MTCDAVAVRTEPLVAVLAVHAPPSTFDWYSYPAIGVAAGTVTDSVEATAENPYRLVGEKLAMKPSGRSATDSRTRSNEVVVRVSEIGKRATPPASLSDAPGRDDNEKSPRGPSLETSRRRSW